MILKDLSLFLQVHQMDIYQHKEDIPLRIIRVLITEIYKYHTTQV